MKPYRDPNFTTGGHGIQHQCISDLEMINQSLEVKFWVKVWI